MEEPTQITDTQQIPPPKAEDGAFKPLLQTALRPLIDSTTNTIILGRSAESHAKTGMKSLVNLGIVSETQGTGDDQSGRKVAMDAEFPHIVFISGKRGSGKSYTLGILAEELSIQKTGVGIVVIDPIGVFWSMKLANRNVAENEKLKQWGLEAAGLKNIKILAPIGVYKELGGTVDGYFAIAPKDLTADDWCLMFDIDRFSTQGLLIGNAIDMVKAGFKYTREGKGGGTLANPNFSLGDLIQCINYENGMNSKETGFALATRRSMVARFQAASTWGIFDTKDTPMDQISVANQATIIDVSHPNIGDEIRSLIVGIIARKILASRIETSRMEDAAAMGVATGARKRGIPVTWLLLDEAHLMVPPTKGTVASGALIEYAKLGRKPGCGLVLATQRPAATNDEILSQVDILIGHNLALEDDMAAMRKRMPAKIDPLISQSDFIRSIPVGIGVVADQKTQERTMVVQFRPRFTQHGGGAARPKVEGVAPAVEPAPIAEEAPAPPEKTKPPEATNSSEEEMEDEMPPAPPQVAAEEELPPAPPEEEIEEEIVMSHTKQNVSKPAFELDEEEEKPAQKKSAPPPPPSDDEEEVEEKDDVEEEMPAPPPKKAAPPAAKPAAPAPSGEPISLEHFIYGSHGGYTMKAKSAGVDPNGHTEPFKGMMLPIKQSDVKTMTEIRAILPLGYDLILLSRIIKGEKDDKGRGTIANHTALIPRKMLESGTLTYEGVDAEMAKWESVAENLGAVGDIPLLEVPKAAKAMDIAELKNYMPKIVVDKMVENYKKDKERKIFVNYKRSTEAQRVKAGYLLSMLLDMKLRVMPLAIFTDIPYRADEASPFNLVLSRSLISIKPGGSWIVLTADTEGYGQQDVKKDKAIKSTLEDIYN